MRIIKKFAYAAVAVACAVGIAGCDQKKAKEYAGPKVAEGAIVAIAGRSAETTSLAPLVKQYKLDGISPDKMSQLPGDAKDFIKEIGLDKADAKWFAVTVGDLSVLAKDGVPEFAVSMVATLNLDATIAAVDKKCKEKKEDVSFNKTTIAGVPAYEIVSKKDEKVVPCVAALEGQLIIGASSTSALRPLRSERTRRSPFLTPRCFRCSTPSFLTATSLCSASATSNSPWARPQMART